MISPTVWIIVALSLGLISGALIAWLIGRILSQRASEEIKIQFAATNTELKMKTEKLQEVEQVQASLREENESLKIQVAQMQMQHETDKEKIGWVDQAAVIMRETFEALASQSLQTNSDYFLSRSREQVESLLKLARSDWGTQKVEIKSLVEPLHDNLSALDQHIRDLEQKREGAYEGLNEQLRQLARTHAELQNTTVGLSQALRSSSVRGRWGELQLRRVVEMAGMVEHITFDEQATTDNGRPDMIVYLPRGGVIPIDSKAPMDSYLE